MEDFHRYLGEGLFVIYVVVMITAFIIGRRGRDVPPWLTGTAHGLLGLQVALGLILLMSGGLGGVSWLHPVIGLLAIAALGLAPVFKARLRPGLDKAALFGVVAILVITAQLIAQLGRS
jgi:heme A synthase